MNKDNKLVPRLRFPEFLNMGEWVECSIDSIGNVVTGGTPSKEEKEFWDGNFVWITAQDFKEKYIFNSVLKLTQKGKDKSRVIPKNSVLVTCIASIGLNAINKVECATNQQINTIVCNAENHYEFVYYAISQNINKLKNLAGQTAVPIINKSVFEKFTIHKPKSSDEQQKIASCLSSLDELISAHTQKLDALKEHKKGLMQLLFPAEGETVPKLRFKEFENDGVWVEKNIASIGHVVTGGTPSKDDKEFWDGDFVWITAQDFKDKYIFNSVLKLTQKGKNKSRIIPKDSVLVTCIASIGLNAINKVECATNQQINAIVCNEDNFFEFVYYAIEFDKIRLKSLAGQTAVPIINKTIFEGFEMKIPKKKEEQQKIASCLSFLDDEITAQMQKIEGLKEHKRGLMQGLFPSRNE
jgi:type I restriction enzyme S subunit